MQWDIMEKQYLTTGEEIALLRHSSVKFIQALNYEVWWRSSDSFLIQASNPNTFKWMQLLTICTFLEVVLNLSYFYPSSCTG